ncbi:MAG TPA: hypothetical protein VGN17_03770 [Bryobacteraceae bacterium]
MARIAAVLVFVAVLAGGLYGIDRSLWLDEAWTANSLREPTLAGMYHYSGWLQVNPPLFLLLARGTVHVIGLSSAAFRVLPLGLTLLAFISLLAAGSRVLSPALALLAATLVMLDPTAIEYSHTLKPYSGELATSSALLLMAILYLQNPSRGRYLGLLAALVVALPLGYASVFVLPGIVLAVYFKDGLGRAVGLALAAGAVLIPEYWFFIRPNLSPQLHDFWSVDSDNRTNAWLVAGALLSVAAGARIAVSLWKSKPDGRILAQLVCVLPCLLLAASRILGLYPTSHRTRLFVLPCLALLLAMILERAAARFLTPAAQTALLGIAIIFAASAVANQIIQHRKVPEEDYAAAVPFLQRHVAPGDLLLVHASSKEGLQLYSAMNGWRSNAVFGDTGWPCCVPGKDGRPHTSTEHAVLADLDAKIPRGFSSRIWLLYSTRPTHWMYVGLDEGDLWRKHVWERGCPPGPYLRFENLAVSPMSCTATK